MPDDAPVTTASGRGVEVVVMTRRVPARARSVTGDADGARHQGSPSHREAHEPARRTVAGVVGRGDREAIAARRAQATEAQADRARAGGPTDDPHLQPTPAA